MVVVVVSELPIFALFFLAVSGGLVVKSEADDAAALHANARTASQSRLPLRVRLTQCVAGITACSAKSKAPTTIPSTRPV